MNGSNDLNDPNNPHSPNVPNVPNGSIWLAAALLTALPLITAMSRELWEIPLNIFETVGIFDISGVMLDTADAEHALLNPEAISFFDPNTRSWYRPFMFATWYASWHLTHSIDATMASVRLIFIAVNALSILGFLLLLRPRSLLDYGAAMVALSIFVGMPGFRMNLEMPLLYTNIGILFALMAWWLLEREHTRWHAPALVLLVILAVGYKEQGLVLVPLIVAAWWVGAPGARWGTAAAVTALTLAYLAMRFTTTGTWHPFEQDIAIGFTSISKTEASERFGAFPYWAYAYNAIATVGNVLFSEPTDGTFSFVYAVLNGGLRWQSLNAVLTSTAVTALLVWWAIHAWRHRTPRVWSPELRLVVALVVAIAASGALGFNYSRERLGGMAVVFYALASYYALREAALRLTRAGVMRLAVACVATLLLAAGWQSRMVGTISRVHEWGRSAHREWIADRQQLRTERARDPRFLEIFNAMEAQGLAPIRVYRYEMPIPIEEFLGED